MLIKQVWRRANQEIFKGHKNKIHTLYNKLQRVNICNYVLIHNKQWLLDNELYPAVMQYNIPPALTSAWFEWLLTENNYDRNSYIDYFPEMRAD